MADPTDTHLPPELSRRHCLGAMAVAVAAAALTHAGDAAGEENVDAAIESISKARANLKTLVAKLKQTRVLGLLSSEVTSSGELTIVRPDKLRWELSPPDAVTYWVLPDGVSMKTKSGKVTKAPKDAGKLPLVLNDLLVFMGGDLKSLGARYDLNCPSKTHGITLVATPKSDELKKLLSRLELVTTPELWALSKVVIEEPGGDSSTIVFSDSQRDVKVDPSRMIPA